MNSQQIEAFDWHRLLVGQVPLFFMLETAIRALVIYIVLLGSMRLMGKRTASQLSLSELAITVTLGAAVGVPMQAPERGLLPAVIILLVAILFQRGINTLGFRRGNVTRVVEGDASILLEDGVLNLKSMKLSSLPREHLFAVLRGEGVEQLGQVRRVYMEASGKFSVFKTREPQPGLSIIPNADVRLRALEELLPGHWACTLCGCVTRQTEKPTGTCGRCGQCHWTEAVIETRRTLAESQ